MQSLRTFCERNFFAVANLSETSKAEPASRKRSADTASLVRTLKGTNALAFEKVRNKNGKSIDTVMDEEDKEAALSALQDLSDEDSNDEDHLSKSCRACFFCFVSSTLCGLLLCLHGGIK